MIVWRICRAGRTSLDGEGARRYPGRWNALGIPMVYCASSLSLATLEVFVHTDPDDVPADLVAISIQVPDKEIESLDPAALPPDWRDYPGPIALRDFGTAWAIARRSLALRVPSAITPGEDNVLLNPAHPAAARLVRSAPSPFAFDTRMMRRRP